GQAPLLLQNPVFKSNNQGFSIINPTFPVTVAPRGTTGDSIRLVVRFRAPLSQGLFSDTLFIQNNDSAASKRPWKIYYEARKDTAGFTLLNSANSEIDTLDFGRICIGNAQTLSYIFKNASSIPINFNPANVNLVDKSNFSISLPSATPLAINQQTSAIPVTFTARSAGKIETKIYMSIAECGFKDSLIVRAEGINSKIDFVGFPSFDEVLINSTKTINVVLKNNGQNDAFVQRTSDVISPPFYIINTTPGPLPALLKPGQELTIAVEFRPIATGDFTAVLKMASLFQSGTSCIDTAQGLLTGRGIDLNVQTTAASLAYGIVARCDTKLDSVRVVNRGSAPVQITASASISGADNTAFEIIRQPGGLPLTLLPGDFSPYYVVAFRPQAGNDGAKSAQLQIPTNDPNNAILSVELSAEQRSLIVTDPSPVILDPIPVPQSSSKGFTITNLGVLDAQIRSIRSRRGITTINPALPQIILANNNSVTFTATMQALKAGQIYDTLEIIYNEPCIDTQYVYLNAKGIQGSVAHTDNLRYGTLSVCRDSIQQISFTNTGEADIVFKSAVVIGLNAGVYSILNPVASGTIIEPGALQNFSIIFNPQNSTDGFKTAEVQTIIEIAGIDQTFTTMLEGTRQTAILETPMSPVNFGVVELESTSELDLTLYNNSIFEMTIDQAQLDAITGGGIFEALLDQPGVTLPHVLKTGENLRIRLKFTPKEQTRYTDTLRLNIVSPCNDKKVIAIIGTGGSSLRSVISMPDTIAATPGIQNFAVPMYIQLDKTPTTPITTGFKAEIAYDASVYSVRRLSRGTITRRDRDAVTGEEVIEITVDNIALTAATRFVATELQGNIYLGETDYTPLHFKSFTWTGTIPRLDSTDDGSIEIDGICYEGGVRLVRKPDGDVVLSVLPNPVSTEADITVFAIETGTHLLEMYTAQGVKVWEQSFSHSGAGQTYVFKTPVSSFADGMYTMVLKTPAKTRTKQFLILK
ncbi:MAG TPA: choice-of-anchor D domain-containing protein, partial [Patescibacteria group bacterium]|nr:choice-of-anchor D domain-containing protein [Patescibacteria group bacterium]